MNTPRSFEDRITAALRERADTITAPPGLREAVDRRIGRRARTRRLVRGVVALVVVSAVVIAAVAVRGRGHDADVVTVPSVAAVHIPQLGLPPGTAGVNQMIGYQPGRQVQLTFRRIRPENQADRALLQLDTAVLQLTVSDASPADVAAQDGAGISDATTANAVNGHSALVYPTDPYSSMSRATVAWQPADHVVAQLTISDGRGPDTAASSALLLAAGLVELDDATWWAMLNPVPGATGLGLTDNHGTIEIATYNPGIGSGNTATEVLDTAGWPPATFYLTSGMASGTPGLFDGTGPDDFDVRSTRGTVTNAPGFLQRTPWGARYTHTLHWAENNVGYELDFTDAASSKDAVKVANLLTTLSEDQWHDALFPAVLRVDLVPLPNLTEHINHQLSPYDTTAIVPGESPVTTAP